MMPGPPKKPTALRLLEGNRGHQKINRREPKPRRGKLEPPAWMKGAALEMWARIVPELDRLKMLTVVDGGALEGACAAYGRAVECHKYLQQCGLTFSLGENGYEQQRPEVAIEQKAWLQFRAFCAEFGLTPAARGRIQVGAKSEDDQAADGTLDGDWLAREKPAEQVVQ